MKCNCESWRKGTEFLNEGFSIALRFCPWCGDLLMPDAVETTIWLVRTGGATAATFEKAIFAQTEFQNRADKSPRFQHFLEIEKSVRETLKIHNPK